MKKLLAIAVVAVAFGVMADGEFSPTIGVSEVAVTRQNTIVPVKYKSLDTVNDVKAKDLVHPQGIPDLTELYVFVGNAYKAFVMDNGEWVALPSGNTSTGTITPAEASQVAVAGTAIWLIFPDGESSVQLPAAGKVFIFGQVITSPTSTVAVGATEAPVSNLLCNPTDSKITGDALITKLAGVAAKGDTISPIGESFTGNYIYNGTQWKHYYNDEEGNMAVEKNKLPDIAAGAGFWYVSKGGSGTIQWN